jgi:hypothetical protein
VEFDSMHTENGRMLIVAEHGANWEKWVDRALNSALSVEVIVRHANERFVNFALRVRGFARRRREPITVAVLLSTAAEGDTQNDTLRRGWELIAHSIHRIVTGPGEVVLVSPL